jgi:ATP-dependent HslUV protease subunit HslV
LFSCLINTFSWFVIGYLITIFIRLMEKNKTIIRATTVVCVRDEKSVVIASDGQVTLGTSVMKSNANKIRTFNDEKIIVGFAGSTADAFTLFERLEKKCEEYSYNLKRACVELAKDWRTDKYLRRLESMIIAADKNETFLISGTGDVLEPEQGVIAIGSGGNFALSAARALKRNSKLGAKEIATESLKIAAELCIYTNETLNIAEIKT